MNKPDRSEAGYSADTAGPFESTDSDALALSIVLPAHNEALNLPSLIGEIHQALNGVTAYEIIVVDDGSADDTQSVLNRLAAELSQLRILKHHNRCGQSAALLTGIRAARAPWIATLDSDGQNDPADIPKLLTMLGEPDRPENLQLVAGQRVKRRDTRLKRLSSRVANRVRARLLRDSTPDTGCGLKLVDRQAALAIPFFDHFHRFLPALILRGGGQVISVPVNHRPRDKGKSHYGLHNRLWVGIVDILGVMWLQRRGKVPKVTEIRPAED